MTTIIRKTPKEIKELYCKLSKERNEPIEEEDYIIAFAYFDYDLNDNVICVPYHVRYRFILHELGHIKLGHTRDNELTVGKVVTDDIDADLWAYSKLGKRIPADEIVRHILFFTRRKIRPNSSFNFVLNHLKSRGIELTRHEKHIIWQSLILKYKNEDAPLSEHCKKIREYN
jgi:hypothetical protein